MSLLAIGINHNTAPLKVRERVSFTKRRLKETFAELNQVYSVLAAVILSTCNRTEFYAHPIESKEQIIKFILKNGQLTKGEFRRYFYLLENIDAIRHIFKVASGLDSQVLGEIQILGQVRSAWITARGFGVINALLERVFAKAVDTGKIVRLETKISQGNVSIGSIAIKMLEERFKDLHNKSILIIGAGKIGALVSKYLKKRETRGIFVSNRTYEKAAQLALDCGGEAINFNQLNEKLKTVDVVISSTASPHLVLREQTLAGIMQARAKPLLIMDLALPRDVDPNARNIPHISLYDLDDLRSVVEENFAKRKQEAKIAEEIIQRELDKFLDTKWRILCQKDWPLELVPDQAP